MFFSIIIPTCNRNESLSICLENLFKSIQKLSLIDCEVLVTDDGNLSQAKSLVDEKFEWARWIAGPKKGPAANRNNGVKYAKGTWLIFLDDDCIPDQSLLLSYREAIFSNKIIQVFEGCIKPEGPPKTPLDYAPINEDGGHLWSCNFCISKDLFLYLNGFDEKFKFPHLEDVDLLLRIKDNNIQTLFCSHAIVIHPWRKFTNGKTLALYNEMDFYYAKKHSRDISIIRTFLAIIQVHVSMFIRNPNFLYFFTSLKVGIEHSIYFLLFSKAWKKKYFIK